eukprot:EG_transcript_32096
MDRGMVAKRVMESFGLGKRFREITDSRQGQAAEPEDEESAAKNIRDPLLYDPFFTIPLQPKWGQISAKELDRLLAEQAQATTAASLPKKLKPIKPEDVRPVHKSLKMDAEGKAQGAAADHVRFDDE